MATAITFYFIKYSKKRRRPRKFSKFFLANFLGGGVIYAMSIYEEGGEYQEIQCNYM